MALIKKGLTILKHFNQFIGLERKGLIVSILEVRRYYVRDFLLTGKASKKLKIFLQTIFKREGRFTK